MPLRSSTLTGQPPRPSRGPARAKPQPLGFRNLIEDVYAAAIEDLPWPAFARQLTEGFAAAAAAAVVLEPAGEAPRLLFATWPEAAATAWQRGLWRGDPWLAALSHLEAVPGPTVLGALPMPEGRFAEEFATPLGLHHAMLGGVTLVEGGRLGLLLHRPARGPRFSPAERHALASLLGHVPRAMSLAQEVARTRAAAGAAGQRELERLPLGVAAVDTALHLLWMNPAFEDLLRGDDPLRLVAGDGEPWPHLVVQEPPQHGALAAAVTATATGQARLQAARLRRGADGAPVMVFVSPLEAGPAVPAGALLVACPLAGAGRDPVALLGQLFELTRPEAEVALALAQGTPAATLAAARGITPAAVQGKLRQAVAKTGAGNAAELLPVLALLLEP